MTEPDPLISVIIPVKNGDAWLDKTLTALLRQTLASSTEIIVIDSGSVDNTLAILSRYPVRLISIDAGDFNHGDTRNFGIQISKAPFVVMTVQDAEAADEFWLQNLLDGFDEETVAAVCGQQIVPHDLDKNPVDWFRPISPPGRKKYQFANAADFNALPDGEKRKICSWDNVNAMYRREMLTRLPFPRIDFAEDALWAKNAILAGYAIVYNNAAKVKHYHHETPEYAFRRSFAISYHFFKIFNVKPVVPNNEPVNILRNSKLLLSEKAIRWSEKWKWLRFNYLHRRAVRQAAEAFYSALAKGEGELDRMYNEFCDSPPQAIKPAKNPLQNP
jgi:rhamnosyltransferase